MKPMLLSFLLTVPSILFCQSIPDTNTEVGINSLHDKIIDDQPTYPGCEDIEDKVEKKMCSDLKMLNFIYSHVKYPRKARKNGIEGIVVVNFIVEKDGSISNAEVVKDIGDGCGQEALRVVNLMPNWVPGKKDGKVVRVQFDLSVQFKLE